MFDFQLNLVITDTKIMIGEIRNYKIIITKLDLVSIFRLNSQLIYLIQFADKNKKF